MREDITSERETIFDQIEGTVDNGGSLVWEGGRGWMKSSTGFFGEQCKKKTAPGNVFLGFVGDEKTTQVYTYYNKLTHYKDHQL